MRYARNLSQNILALLLLLILSLAQCSLAQQCNYCQPNGASCMCSPSGADCGEPTEANAYGPGTTSGWPPNFIVNVNINSTGMTADQVTAVSNAFQAWNGVGGVKFTITVSTGNISEADGNYNVNYGSLNGTPAPNAYSSPANNDNGFIVANNTTLNNQITCLQCLTDAMAHDIGHSFGLNDNDYPDGSVMDDGCGTLNSRPPNCGSPGPTSADLSASDCENTYPSNNCYSPETQSPQCSCSSGNCPGGLTCQNGFCGCTNACDDPSCPGYSCDSCGTNCAGSCTTDGDCSGGLVCIGGTCGCGNSCDDPSCAGYDACNCEANPECDPSCSAYDLCTCDPSDPSCGGGCSDPCDPSCDNYDPSQCGGEDTVSSDGPIVATSKFGGVPWKPVGIVFALILPAMVTVRRRRPDDPAKSEESGNVE